MSSGGGIGNLSPVDVAVIATYFVGCIGVGMYTICKARGNIRNFFLASRSMVWWPVGMSLFASNIGSVNFVGIAGTGAASGLAVVMFEWSATFLLVLLGWVFLPVYISSGIYTMPEYLQRRFGGQRLRIYLSCVALFTYVFATLSSDLFSGALFIQQTIGWSIWASVGALLIITVVFTALGGLATVIFTDALAVVIMITGGFVLCIVGFIEVGGYENLYYKYMRAIPNTTLAGNTTCGYPREDAYHIFRHIWTADYPWLGTLLRTTFGSLWYWCANQVLVQRALASKNITHAKGATILAGYLKLTPLFIMVLPGMISRALFPDEVACADPEICLRVCDNAAGCSNIAYPKLVVELLPNGLRGLLIAAMIAAVISSLTSIFNSSSTLFTLDIWAKIRPKAGERELLIVGRLCSTALVIFACMWIPAMSSAEGGEIFRYSTTVTGYMGAPTCAIFILALAWRRITERGAFWGMLIAQIWGLVRFVLDFVYPAPGCGNEDTRIGFVKNFHAYYFTMSQIILAFVLAIIISLIDKPIDDKKLAGLTFWTRKEKPLHDIEREMEIEIRSKEKERQADREEKENKDVEVKQVSFLRHFLHTIIGTSQQTGEEQVEEEYEPYESRLKFLKETKMWKKITGGNAIFVMTLTVFLYGFFY